ncbi:MAG: efflux RND transporter periplasmic adaptor subunit [Bacteroidaceae bacterium]|nr:efflux RND transporter periplasmic adaptor subunit [Bacteroidaceae bacterium]
MRRIIFMIALILFVTSCKEQKSEKSSIALPIEVSKPIIKEVTLTREYPGYLDADATVNIVSRVNGTLESNNYKAGSRVKKGDLLFVIEPILYKNAVTQAKATLETAIANLEYARINYKRIEQAAKSDAVSRSDLSQAKTKVDICEAEVSSAQAALETAQQNLEYCYIRAPHNGIMSLSNYSVGNYIAGTASPVVLGTLYKDDIMYAYFDVTDNQWLRQQQRPDIIGKEDYIIFSLGEDQYYTYKAKMDYLSPSIETGTGTLRVRAQLNNNDRFLKPGSYINVTLPYKKLEKALLVTDASIGNDQLGSFIYVVNDSNIVEYRHITIGNLVDDTLRIVTEGISPTERYVSKALMKVRNGMKVSPYIGNNNL